MSEDKTIIITISGFQLKGLGNTRERVMEEFGYPVEVRFIRSYSYPPIMFDGFVPNKGEKIRISEIISEEAEFGLLVDE